MNAAKFHALKVFARRFSSDRCFQKIASTVKSSFSKPKFDRNFIISYLDDYAEHVLARRKTALYEQLVSMISLAKHDHLSQQTMDKLIDFALGLPNKVHPSICNYEEEFKVIKTVGSEKEYPFEPLDGTYMLQEKDLLKCTRLAPVCGERSYYLTADGARLEQALVDYTLDVLLSKGFNLISVPDILREEILEKCGMSLEESKTRVYKLDPKIYGPGWCLSGTSEAAIAAFLMNENLDRNSLPKYYAATSRCYRAESSSDEKPIYRVHQFTKVEMFGVCLPNQSDKLLERFLAIQEELFSSYDLHYRVIDIAPHKIGRQAYRKYDVEAWMPGTKIFGEISSCSNCLDYQTRRLNIKSDDTLLHTVNGTACAIPRTILAIAETHQIEKGRVTIPSVLRPYFGKDVLGMNRGPRMNDVISLPVNLLKENQYTF